MRMPSGRRFDRDLQKTLFHATLALLGAGIFFVAGCAKTPSYPDPIPVAAIDLEPRCGITADGLPTLESGNGPDGSMTEPGDPLAMKAELPSRGLFIVDAVPGSGLATLRWGFRAPPEASPSALHSKLDLAAALLRAGETARDPSGFRNRVLALGGRLATRIEEDWLWLELGFPETLRNAALGLFFEWHDARRVDAPALERIRREVALARLTRESLPDAMAVEVFRRMHPPPPGAARGRRPQRGRSDWSAEEMESFLSTTLSPEASVVVYSGSLDPREAEFVRRQFESRIEEIFPG
ncbi:MAG TPA: hypothetical protein ENI85_16720, partial [Deltaproteobacteria bacterium]|nr:hypothetical protein [Deltaproteobacteria bacterium]